MAASIAYFSDLGNINVILFYNNLVKGLDILRCELAVYPLHHYYITRSGRGHLFKSRPNLVCITSSCLRGYSKY